MKIKFIIYVSGLRSFSGGKSGEFAWSSKHNRYIYQGRELEMKEFNDLMEKNTWPLQKIAGLNVCGFAFEEKEEESLPTPQSQIVSDKVVEIVNEPSEIDEKNDVVGAVNPAIENESEQPAPELASEPVKTIAEEDSEQTIPRNPRKKRKTIETPEL